MNEKANSIGYWGIALGLVSLVLSLAALLSIPHQASQPLVGGYTGGVTNYDNLTLTGQLVTGKVNSRADGLATTTLQLAATDIVGISTIIETAATSATPLIVSFPATSTLSSFLPHVGDYTQFFFYNASTTGPSVQFASSTGSIIKTATGTVPTILGGAAATIDADRVDLNDIVFTVSPTAK